MAGMKHACIFGHPMIRDEVNPRLAAIDPKTPFGAFQRTWRNEHCKELNPYGSEDCPYRPEDCVLAYWKTAADALGADKSPIGLFRVLARRRAYDRADSKPLARERINEKTGSDRSSRPGRDPAGPGLPRSASRPTRIGELLGTLDLGARQRRVDEGEEGPR